MKTYNLKSVARRGSMLTAAFVVAGASLLPFLSPAAHADALNPLTDRSLTLSSSAPGWDFKDGSGNTTYADPNSGANGQKTGNTFSFKVSTDNFATSTTLRAFTFQYCTRPAGTCTAPGNNGTTSGTRNPDSVTGKTSDLNIASSSPSEVDNTGDAFINSGSGAVTALPNKNGTQGNYIVMKKDVGDANWSPSAGWTMTVTHNEDGQSPTGTTSDNTVNNGPTGANNFITLTNSTGLQLQSTGQVKIVFFGTTNNYITNPGLGAFFVKINDYTSTTTMDDTTLVDGGVTVANVMNLGISIQTKVLETMDFSVGTVDPYTLTSDGTATSQLGKASNGTRLTHGSCDPVMNSMDPAGGDKPNTLLLGSAADENSLQTDHTYSTHSYFRLSSNASAGATVYYSGVTLSNTVGDQIKAMNPTKGIASRGTEQFGLALSNNPTDGSADATYAVNYKTERATGAVYESGADNAAAGLVALNDVATPATAGTGTGIDSTVATDWTTGGISGKLPMLKVNTDGTTLTPTTNYNQGGGVVNTGIGYAGTPAQFAFDTNSNIIPTAIAQEGTKVVDCASAKVRYIANIAATTPAGIYTTKINYIAAPQY